VTTRELFGLMPAPRPAGAEGSRLPAAAQRLVEARDGQPFVAIGANRAESDSSFGFCTTWTDVLTGVAETTAAKV
jgi:hypothetical protein